MTQTTLKDLNNGKRGDWKRYAARDTDHRRWNKVHDDATVRFEFETHPNRNDLQIRVEETYEIANGQTRSHTVSFGLTAENVRILRVVLAKIDTWQENP